MTYKSAAISLTGFDGPHNRRLKALLLLVPGSYFAVSNYLQNYIAMQGFTSLAVAVFAFIGMFAVYNVFALALYAARYINSGRHDLNIAQKMAAHAVVILIGATGQLLLIALAVALIRVPDGWQASLGTFYYEILVSCVPIWVGLYVIFSWLDIQLTKPESSVTGNVADRLEVRAEGRSVFVTPQQIHQVRALGDYVQIYMTDRILTVKQTMAELESRLTEKGFIRVHRGALVNSSHIQSIQRMQTGAYRIMLNGGASVPLSRRRLATVREHLHTAVQAS